MRCDAWAGALSWWSCPSPVAHRCGLLNHPNSFHRGMLSLNIKLDADSLLYSLSQFDWDGNAVHNSISLNSIYHRHRLVQWSHQCSHKCIPVFSSWLPGYIDVVQTVSRQTSYVYFLPKAYKTRELKEKDVCMSGLLLVSPTVLFLIYYDREDVRVGVEAEWPVEMIVMGGWMERGEHWLSEKIGMRRKRLALGLD